MNENNNDAVGTDSGLNEYLAYHSKHFKAVDFASPCAREFAAEVVKFEQARQAANAHPCAVGVGDGTGNLLVHGSYDAVKRVQAMVLELEAARSPQPYDDVLLPFLAMMRAELHANAHKGDRPGWLTMDRKTAMLEVFYHMGKLHQAVHRKDTGAVIEYAADVANMCMMLVDVCGLLTEEAP